MQMMEEKIQQLKKRLVEAKSTPLRKLLKQAEATVAKWQEATGTMYSPEPWYSKRYPGGRWKREGENIPNAWAHGFDSDGRTIIMKCEGATLLYKHEQNLIEELRVFDDFSLAGITQYEMVAGQVVRSVTVHVTWIGLNDYTWENGRVVRSELHIAHDWMDMPEAVKKRTDISKYGDRFYSYTANGELECITLIVEGAKPKIEYRKPKKSQTVVSVAEEIEESLVQLIPLAVKRKRPKDPLYCIFLSYCSSGWDLTPVIYLATIKDREQAIGDDFVDLDVMWGLNDLPRLIEIHIGNAGFSRKWSLLHQLMRESGEFFQVPNLLRRVAQSLNHTKLDPEILCCDEFVFTAADSADGVPIGDDLPASVSNAQLSVLKKHEFWA